MRVLVVDDEISLAETLRRRLRAEGFVVAVAHDGVEGLDLAVNEGFDVIVLDIMLPGLNGYEVVRELRRRRIWTPVLMLSAKDGDYDMVDAFDMGADDYLTKPFSHIVLTARLRALQRRGNTERPPVITVGDLSLDPGRHRVHRGEQHIELTPREFAVLEYLMRHPGHVVSKTDILRSVWDTHYDGDTNVVEIYIGYLRRKIDTPFGRSSIETVRGVGYRIREE
ncbi:response regulator transcription factor [Nocardia nova]|uniref:response regulator transcription factor n=1 Tax=Nocardia nova TaxID=37330 RepID=UPI0007A40ED2|nr:response regulator transcription factor [Nocardia nova]